MLFNLLNQYAIVTKKSDITISSKNNWNYLDFRDHNTFILL